VSDQETVTYAYYPVLRLWGGGERVHEAAGVEWEVVFKEHADAVRVRGFYSAQGFRPDADLMMWWVSESPDAIQDLMIALRRTELGSRLELTHAFLGAVRPPEFNPRHQPAFMRGEDPKKYLCVYPFVRTPEWYLMKPYERRRLLKEHGQLARDFPDVLPNTTSSFGLSDWEWILAFEADGLERIVDCIRRLRDAEARRYTKEEVPFVIGIRKPLGDVVTDLA
jgi:chlorite dismutase